MSVGQLTESVESSFLIHQAYDMFSKYTYLIVNLSFPNSVFGVEISFWLRLFLITTYLYIYIFYTCKFQINSVLWWIAASAFKFIFIILYVIYVPSNTSTRR